MLNKTFGFSALFIAAFLLASNVHAAGDYVGTIDEVWVNGATLSDVGWIKVSGSITGSSCGDTKWWILDLDNNRTMEIAMSVALAAQVAGKEVRIQGTGSCNGQYEYVQVVAIK